MATETSDLRVVRDLLLAGIIDEDDVVESNPDQDEDNIVTSTTQQLINGRGGDDTYIGVGAKIDDFIFAGRDGNGDEGRHVNIVQNFSYADGDILSLKFEDGYFTGLPQDAGPVGAEFKGARALADLLLFMNQKDGIKEGLGITIDPADVAANTNSAGKVDLTYRAAEAAKTIDGSFVRVENGHIVINFDDSGTGETVDREGNYRTDDVMVVFDKFEARLAAQFAVELGYENELESSRDSVHIATSDGGTLDGHHGDNLFILSNSADTVSVQRSKNTNDEGAHVNIVHGFDLAEDSLFFSTDVKGQFIGGSKNGKFKTFDGAAGLVGVLATSAVSGVQDGEGDLHFDIQLRAGDAMTMVLTNTTLADIHAAAEAQTETALVGSGVAASEEDVRTTLLEQGAETATFASGDGGNVDVLVGFNQDDRLAFDLGSQALDGFDFSRYGDATDSSVGFSRIDKLGDYLNDLSAADPDNLSAAYFDADTNSTVLVIDETPGQDGDELSIVLWDSGDLI
ncbi:MAG: hypothetical protein AAF253_05430 [Pseudomonadota bacterium]